MSHIKLAALLDKAFKFTKTVKGDTAAKLGSQIDKTRYASNVLKKSIEVNKKAKKPNAAFQKNLELGAKQQDARLQALYPRYQTASKATNKARAYTAAATVAVVGGAAGAATRVHNRKEQRKKDAILERINNAHPREYDK